MSCEDIETGDYVWSENPETNEITLKQVVRTFIHPKDTLVIIHCGDEVIETTEEHPFYVENKGWVRAKNLELGDALRLIDGSKLEIDYIDVKALNNVVNVYNLEISDFHTYFVGESCVLVHNDCDVKAFIKHSTYNEIRNKYGKEAVDKFINSMKKGIVSSKGENGIKFIKGKGINFGDKLYKYEIKVKGNLGDYRIYGNYDEKLKHIVFDQFGKGKH